jgi:hypothetical protein
MVGFPRPHHYRVPHESCQGLLPAQVGPGPLGMWLKWPLSAWVADKDESNPREATF